MIRLNKFLAAKVNIVSRRKADEMIAAGKVWVNGQQASLGQQINEGEDEIRVDGRVIGSPQNQTKIAIAIYKPRGVISSAVDEDGRKTVTELVDIDTRLYPVGRLDKDSEGLMILTNDGDLALKLTHPRYQVAKTYRVLVRGRVKPEELRKWQDGGKIDGEQYGPVNIKLIDTDDSGTELDVVLREGKKREIREIMGSMHLWVVRLCRVKIGNLEIGDLKPGEWRRLAEKEVQNLRGD